MRTLNQAPSATAPQSPPPATSGIDGAMIDTIVRRIAEYCAPERILMFGSQATGQATAESDLDLLVIMPSELPRHWRAVPIRRLFQPSPCPMDILVYTPDEVEYWMGTANHIVTTAVRTGKLLYERP